MWKTIKDADGYEVNDLGIVRSKERQISQWNGFQNITRTYKSVELKFKYIRGYKNVSIVYNDKKKKTKQVHRLILETFNPIENMKEMQVNHIDGNKANNALINLEWMTPKENVNHAIQNGLTKPKEQNGEKNHMAKLNDEKVIQIKILILNGNSDRSIAENFGVSRQTINNIRNNKSWKHIVI